MTAPEVEWVLQTLQDNVFGYGEATYGTVYSDEYTLENGDPVALKFVDRDDAQVYGGDEPVEMSEPLPEREGELQSGAYLGASLANGSETPIGTEFDLDIEHVVGLRLEGLHESKYGHIDPSGANGIPFHELKQRVRSALYDQRKWPDAGDPNVSFTHLQLANEATASSDWRDYFRYDVDVVFDGFETLG